MKKRFSALLLCLAVLMTNVLPVCANAYTPLTAGDNETVINDTDDENSAQTELDVIVGSQFTVAIPTVVALDSHAKGSFNVIVKGDLDPRYHLTIEPTGTKNGTSYSFMLRQGNNPTDTSQRYMNMKTTTEKTRFDYDEINLTDEYTTEYIISHATATDNQIIEAGKWTGLLTFKISLDAN